MFHFPKHPHNMFEQECQAQIETQELVEAQVPTTEEDESSSPTSSFHFFLPSSSSPSCPSSPLIPDTPEEVKVPAAVIPSTSQNPQTTSSHSSSSFSTTLSRTSDENSSSEEQDKSTSTSQDPAGAVSLPRDPLGKKVNDLVKFLLLKYRLKLPVTKEEMLKVVDKKNKSQFPVIFQKACKCMEVICGIDMKEVDPTIQSYILVNSLDLAYDENLSDDQGMPKKGLLIIILGVIFIEGNCVPEEEIWDLLNMMGVHTGRDHFIFGEPRKLITRDWVQEKYLTYRQVPDSDPACYEFLWGPRAHMETSKMKVLEFFAKVNGTYPSSFSTQYEEALRDEEERTKSRIAPADSTASTFLAPCWPKASPGMSED
ncbi:melanoma-associated antigen 10-like [Dasypus novemcinctus]|uniref:melanoma-associated antigen 10-like n=1 Tax=Dasypus novemcinctus TaxID=9361 RepID=UPI000328A27B|nr:melanoma-associated antigen 10-like [Dasypus novemcinctus]